MKKNHKKLFKAKFGAAILENMEKKGLKAIDLVNHTSIHHSAVSRCLKSNVAPTGWKTLVTLAVATETKLADICKKGVRLPLYMLAHAMEIEPIKSSTKKIVTAKPAKRSVGRPRKIVTKRASNVAAEVNALLAKLSELEKTHGSEIADYAFHISYTDKAKGTRHSVIKDKQ